MDRTYRHLMQSDGGYLVQEVRGDGLIRIVDEDHPTYLAWLADGGQPEVVEYVAPQPLSMEDVRAAKVEEIKVKCDAALAPLATEYGVYERASWDQQSAEAKALVANPEADAPLVRQMAATRGIEVMELANRILGHEARWKAVSGTVFGQRQKLFDQVDAATTVEGVQAVEVVYSLPEA